ncbi:MAG: O-antigen ligase family protein [Elusimicrobia bacterium]|nr:O-antigen ligase family protein [Elusimicrobiota bacterium]
MGIEEKKRERTPGKTLFSSFPSFILSAKQPADPPDCLAGIPQPSSFPNWRAVVPALFLLLAAALGGLRDFTGWAVFSVLFTGYLVLFERDFSFSVTGPLALLGLWLALGLCFSPEPLNSFWHFSKYLVFLAFFAFTRSCGEEAGKFWAWAVFVLACLASLFVLFERALALSPAGLIGSNPNYSAAFMAAGLAGAAAACGGAKTPKARLVSGAALTLIAAGILAVNSRGAFLAALTAVFFLFWHKKARRPALYFTGALLLAAAVIPAEYLGWFLKLEDPRSLERLGIWTTAFEAIGRQPVFGFGLGLFEQVFEAFKFPFYNGISYYGHSTLHAHSELLNLSAEAGLPAAALFAWAWGAGVLGGSRTFSERAKVPGGESGPAEKPQNLALKVFAFALFAEAAVDIIFYSGAVQLCFFGTLGLLARPSSIHPDCLADNPSSHPSSLILHPSPRLALYLFVAALAAALFLRRGFEHNRLCAAADNSPAARAACLKKALRFSPGDAELRKAGIVAALLGSGNYARAAALADDAAFKYPKDPFLTEAAAEAYFGGGDAVLAKERLLKTLALEPNFLSARLGLAQMLAGEKNFKAAVGELEKIEQAVKERRPAPKTAYDRALLYLPRAAYEELKTWKKKTTGGNTASTRKQR